MLALVAAGAGCAAEETAERDDAPSSATVSLTERPAPEAAVAPPRPPDPERRPGDAVNDALQWLSAAQNDDGGWGRETGAASDVVSTSYALLAYYSALETHQAGPYKQDVKSGVKRLIALQGLDGAVGSTPEEHVHATLVLTQTYGMSMSKLWREPAVKAVERLLVWTRSPDASSWSPLLTTRAAVALMEGRYCDLDVDAGAIESLRERLRPQSEDDTQSAAMHAVGATVLSISVGGFRRIGPFPDDEWEAIRRQFEPVLTLVATEPERVLSDPALAHLGTAAAYRLGRNLRVPWGRDVLQPVLATLRVDGSSPPAPGWGTVRTTALRVMTARAFSGYPVERDTR